MKTLSPQVLEYAASRGFTKEQLEANMMLQTYIAHQYLHSKQK